MLLKLIMKKLLLLFIYFFIGNFAIAQSFSGRLADKNTGEVLPGANLFWLDTTIGTSTDANGDFELPKTSDNEWLIISYIGYGNDTLYIGEETGPVLVELELSEGEALQEVVVEGQRAGTFIGNDAAKIEVITETELAKSACCDLAGCFSTQASVQPVTTNVVTNAKELRILGLSGVYNQLLFDGMPLIQGLGYTYGVSSYPGTLVNRIFVAKGSNSVLQGYEGMSGQINVIPKNPAETDKLLLNAYFNSNAVKQFNVNYAYKSPKGWANLTAAHIALPGMRMDRNDDTFLDMPLLNRQMIYNKWMSKQDIEKGWLTQIGLRFWNESRVGGQKDFDAKTDKGSSSIYGQTISIQQPEVYTKTAYRLNANQQITFIGSSFFHHQESWYGLRQYNAEQLSAYANLQFEWAYTDKHDVKAGISYRHSHTEEMIASQPLIQNHRIPGLFAENTLSFEKVVLITGFRWDQHQQFGSFFTPRALVRYKAFDNTDIRVSAGTGWRTAHVFAENPNVLASSRVPVFSSQLEPEQSTNIGANVTHKEFWDRLALTVTADAYHTRFKNQIFPDYDSQPGQILLFNFTETSASNAFQIESNFKFDERYEVKFAYTYLDVYRMTNEVKTPLPFNSKHKFMTTFSYQPSNKKWHLDGSLHWHGVQRLPNTEAYPVEFQQANTSSPYTQINVQFTKSWKQFEVYAGVENLLGFRQEYPILSWQDPFGEYFDTAFNWGPTVAQEYFIGVRYRME